MHKIRSTRFPKITNIWNYAHLFLAPNKNRSFVGCFKNQSESFCITILKYVYEKI